MRALACLMFCTAFLTNCAVGPKSGLPSVAGADSPWITPSAPGELDRQWWRALGDPLLDQLVAEATRENLDVREAEARLRESRANRDAAAARALPDLRASGSAGESQSSANGVFPIARIPGFERRYSLFDAGFDAAWELDLWGAVKSSVRGAEARRAGAEDQLADLRLQIIAETVRTYGELRGTQARLAALNAQVALQDEAAALVDRRVSAGESSALEAVQAGQRTRALAASVPGLEADVRARVYRLALIIGRPPEALTDRLLAPAPLPAPPALAATGLRSELLQRRPDVRAAAEALTAAGADVGVETANLFPRVSLVGSLGQQAKALGDITAGSSTRFQVGPSFSWPILSVGRIRAQIRAANARADAAAIAYERAVLTALSDSETAVNRYSAACRAREDREGSLQQAQAETSLILARYRAGEDDRQAWLQAGARQRAAEQQAITVRVEALTAYVSLTKALGGGWATAAR